MRPAFHFLACAYCEISQRRLPGFDAHVIRLYARGMSVREIRGPGLKLDGWEGWPDLISTITDEVLAEVEQWQTRPLEAMYPIGDFVALQLQIRDEGGVKNKAVYSCVVDSSRWMQGSVGALDRANSRGQILAESLQ